MGKQRKRTQRVWVLMHYEFMGPRSAPHLDSVQFHVSSTRARAERYIRKHVTDSHGWWQVHPYLIDDPDPEWVEGDEVYYYSHRGTSLPAAPYKRAKAAFERRPDDTYE